MEKFELRYQNEINEELLEKNFRKVLEYINKKGRYLIGSITISKSLMNVLNIDEDYMENMLFENLDSLSYIFNGTKENLNKFINNYNIYDIIFEFGKKDDVINFKFNILENDCLKVSINIDFIKADVYKKLISDIDNSNFPLDVKRVLKEELVTSISIYNYQFENIIDSVKEELKGIIGYYIDEVEDKLTQDDKSLQELNFGYEVNNYIYDYCDSEWSIAMSKLITYDYINKGNTINIYFNNELLRVVNKKIVAGYKVS